MTTRGVAIVSVGAAALVLAFFAGRFTKPVHMESERVDLGIETQQAISVATTDKNTGHTVTKRKTVRSAPAIPSQPPPPGQPCPACPEVKETIEEEITSDTTSDETAVANATAAARVTLVDEKRVEDYARPSWRLAAQAGWKWDAPSLQPSIYGGEVSRRIVGPVWLGAWARTDSTAGVSLALEW